MSADPASGHPARDLESLVEFEKLISELSSRFVDLPPGEVDGEIEKGLYRVCHSLAATLHAERDRPDAMAKRLQLVAQVFTSALARSRRGPSLRETEARLEAGVELAGLASC